MSGESFPDLGAYRATALLGEGGVGTVYLVEDAEGNSRALKLFRTPPDIPEAILASSRIAGLALTYVENPHLANVHEWIEEPGRPPMLVMDVVDGEDLAHTLARREALEPMEALEIARQIAEALSAAHDAGVLHLDLNPTNVFLVQESDDAFDTGSVAEDAREVKVLDFGSAPEPTAPGAPPQAGTPEYWAPEQAAGKEVDERTDLYALGVMLYEMLTGATPFSSHSYTAIAQAQMRDPPAKMEQPAHTSPIPEALEGVAMRCLAKDPEDRFQSAEDLRAALDHVAEMTAALNRSQEKTNALEPGDSLGDYEILETLGEGAMGRVYLAQHARLERKVAIKVLRSKYAEDEAASERFFTEARAVARIGHENIVEITDFHDEDPATKWYVMELLRGESLRDLLKREKPLSIERLLPIFAQIAAALDGAHGVGIVHRDLKPDNVFLTERHGHADVVKLLDFGIAAELDSQAEKARKQGNKKGLVLGTPQYMAPEQFTLDEIDGRTDTYALGVLLYEALCGKRPFPGKDFGALAIAHVRTPPPPPSAREDLLVPVLPELEALTLRCLSKQRTERPTMAEVYQELWSIAEARLAQPPPEPAVAPEPAPPPSRSVLPIVAAGVVALGLGVGGLALALAGEKETSSSIGALPDAPPIVTLTFKTEPAGAEVFRQGDDEPLGTTPLEVEVESGVVTHAYIFRLAGYEEAKEMVPSDSDTTVRLSLRKKASRKPPPKVEEEEDDPKPAGRRMRRSSRRRSSAGDDQAKPKPKSSGKEQVDGTIDPFAD